MGLDRRVLGGGAENLRAAAMVHSARAEMQDERGLSRRRPWMRVSPPGRSKPARAAQTPPSRGRTQEHAARTRKFAGADGKTIRIVAVWLLTMTILRMPRAGDRSPIWSRLSARFRRSRVRCLRPRGGSLDFAHGHERQDAQGPVSRGALFSADRVRALVDDRVGTPARQAAARAGSEAAVGQDGVVLSGSMDANSGRGSPSVASHALASFIGAARRAGSG